MSTREKMPSRTGGEGAENGSPPPPSFDHFLGRVERKPADEDRESPEQRLLRRGKEIVRPGDSVAQRVLAGGLVAGATGEQGETMFQAVEQGGHREQLCAGRRQFQRERKSVQPTADRDNGRYVGRHQGKAGPHRPDAIQEQGDRGRSDDLFDLRLAEARVWGDGGRKLERGDGVLPLAADPKPLPAGDQSLEHRVGGDQPGDLRGGGGDLFGVVEQEQDALSAERPAQAL